MIKSLGKYLINGEKSSESITQSAFLLAAMGLASRFLGLIRDRLLADKFGAGDVTDAYHFAFKIPDLIYSLLVLGALSAAFLPVFTALRTKGEKRRAWQLANTMLSVGVVVLGIVALVLFIFTPGIIEVAADGYGEEKQQLIVQLTRIMLLSPIILGISGVLGGMLNSFRKFFFYSLAPIFYNLGIIVGISVFYDWLGPQGLGLGVVLGALLHMAVQLPEVFRCGFSFKFHFKPLDKDFKRVLHLMLPRAMGLAIAQLSLLIAAILAANKLISGSLAVFTFANNLQSVPLGLFGVSFAVAAFPTLSSLWSKGKKEAFGQQVMMILRKVLFFMIPCSILIYALRAQIVRVVLGSGEFDWPATVATLESLGVFVLSLWAQGMIPLLARSFYALGSTRTPFYIGLFSEALNLTLALLLIEEYGILGLVGAFSLASIVNALLLLIVLAFRVGEFKVSKEFIWEVNKILLASLVMIFLVQITKELISADPFGQQLTFLGVFTQLVVALMVGGVSFVAVGKMLKIKDLQHFWLVVKARIFNQEKVTSNSSKTEGPTLDAL
jgi:putative peptidoglycan lipid II flippase